MREKKKIREIIILGKNFHGKIFPGQITLIITLPSYLFINLLCVKFLIANEFFRNSQLIIQNQIKLPKLGYIIKTMFFIVLTCFYFLVLRFEYQVSNQVVINCNIPCYPAGIYLLKVNNRNTRTRCEICSKLTIKTPERRH